MEARHSKSVEFPTLTYLKISTIPFDKWIKKYVPNVNWRKHLRSLVMTKVRKIGRKAGVENANPSLEWRSRNLEHVKKREKEYRIQRNAH